MIVVCGATGMLGGEVARRLAGREDLRLLVRPGSLPPDAGGPHETALADLRDRASLGRAAAGARVVVATATAMSRALAGERTDLRAVDGHGMLALVEAAERAGAERFVFVSYAGASAGAARRHPLAAAKLAVERRLERSPMRTVVVRPDQFQEIWLSPVTQFDWPRRRVVVFGRDTRPTRHVAVADVAEAVARLALAPDPPARMEFGGPDALTRSEAVRLFEEVTGSAFTVRRVPSAALRAGMRVLRRPRPHLASVMGLAYCADLEPATWDAAPLEALAIRPRGTRAYAEAVVGAAAA